MQLIIITMCLLIAILSYKYYKNYYNPITVFFTLWGLIVFLAALNLFDMNSASNKTYIIIFVGLVSFMLGFAIPKIRLSVSSAYGYRRNNFFNLNKKIIYILMAITIVILGYTASSSINLLLSGHNLWYVRYIAHNDIVSSESGMLNILYNYLAQPIAQLLIPVSILSLFSKNRDIKLIFGSLIITILLIISNGGRFILLYYLIHLVFIGSFINNKFEITKIVRKRVRIISLFVLTGIIYITVSRGASIGKTLYIYLSGCVPFMSQWVENIDQINTYTYGIMSFQGFIRPFFAFLEKLGLINNFPPIITTAENLTLQLELPVSIGGDNTFNAFVSLFYYFYVDFGFLGVVIISMVFGAICNNAYHNIMSKSTNIDVITYSLILQLILTSMVRFQFASFIFALTFIYLQIIRPRKMFRE